MKTAFFPFIGKVSDLIGDKNARSTSRRSVSPLPDEVITQEEEAAITIEGIIEITIKAITGNRISV